ncbi:hypothetical protein JXA80_12075 [bacterium]|nr:hypothetical protein [candidate division CSSED10-310 bacterium]
MTGSRPAFTRHSIVFYISGHGFGHATRTGSVIRFIRDHYPDIPLYVRSWASTRIFDEMCPDVPVTWRQFDVGVSQPDAVTLDIPDTLHAMRDTLDQTDRQFDAEVADLRALNPGCIVSDIPPVAHRLAAHLEIPSVTLTNFTWDWIYREWVEAHPGFASLIERMERDYRLSCCLLRLPYAGDFPAFANVHDMPMLGRRAMKSRGDTRRQLGLDTETRPLVLLSFGGMGLAPGAMESLGYPSDFCFITTSTVPEGAVLSLHSLDLAGIGYPDLVAAVDIVLTKPGYGIVSECAVNHTRILYTDRGPFREYDAIIKQLDAWNCAAYIPQSRLFGGRWKTDLEELMQRDPASVPRAVEAAEARGAAVVTEHVMGFYHAYENLTQ